MGPLPRHMLIACLTVLRTLLFITGGLLALLVVAQQLRGDAFAQPVQIGLGAVVALGLGWLAGRTAAFFARMS